MPTTPEPDVIYPAHAADVAVALQRAAEARQSIVIRGAGTKADWGRPPSHVDTILDMRALNRILAHEHGDMTATIEAGASLRLVNVALAIHRQTLPLDPPFADRATIGGLLATNDSGPLRHRYGTPRDLVIGVELATTDGVLSKAGGRVVKNVAGYDLGKLVTGSFGSLAAIVSATFKLTPLPEASKTMRIGVRDRDALAGIVRTMMASQLEPIAFEVVSGGGPAQVGHGPGLEWANDIVVLLRFASVLTAVDAQVAQATAALEAFTTSIDVLDGDAERSAWHMHATAIWDQPGAIVRASWLPANIAQVLETIEGMEREPFKRAGQTRLTASPSMHLVGRAAVGAGHLRIDGDAASQAAVVERLRASPILGNVVIVRGSLELKGLIDAWGSNGERQPLFDSLKRAFDPHGVLNAGRGPL